MDKSLLLRIFRGLLGTGVNFAGNAKFSGNLFIRLALGLLVFGASAINKKLQAPEAKTKFEDKTNFGDINPELAQKSKNKHQELEEFFMAKKSYDANEDPRLSLARIRFEKEVNETRARERAKKSKFRRIDWAWKLISVGTGITVFGVTLDALNVGAIGLGILSGAAVGYIGAVINNYIAKLDKKDDFQLVPQREAIVAPQIDDNSYPSHNEVVQKVLLEAATSLQKINDTIGKLKHPDSINSVTQIVTIGKRLMKNVAENPDKLSIAQRVFTYYCPEAVGVAQSLAKIENDAKPDVSRIISTQSILQKLVMLLESTELELKADDNKALDIDLKLLNQSLKSDLKIPN